MDTRPRPLENGWLPDTPTADSVFRRFLLNQAGLNELIAGSAGGNVQRTDDVSLADAGSPVAYLNQAVLLRPAIAADDAVFDQIDAFHSGMPSTLLSLWPTPDLAPRGWELIGHPMLVLRQPGPHGGFVRPDVRIDIARTTDDLATAAQVAIDGYPFDEPGLGPEDLFPPAAVRSGLTVRVASVDLEPVAVGNSYVADGVLNLCLAATLPSARRRGAWSQLVWARIADGPTLPALAFTSDDSRPGFERLGFVPLTRLTLWSRST